MESIARAIFEKWISISRGRRTTDTLRFVVKHQGEVMADLPSRSWAISAGI